MKRLILASTSPRRHDLVNRIGLPFEVARPDIDESPYPDEAPDIYVARLSREKAAAVVPKCSPNSLILSADTTVADGQVIIGKPADDAEAIATLKHLRDREHIGYTGVTVLDTDTGDSTTRVTVTRVLMRPYTDQEIAAYVASGDPMGKAGSYAIQNADFHPVESLDGCYTNIVGLPLCTVCAMLAQHGIAIPAPVSCSPDQLPCTFKFSSHSY